MLEMKKCSKCKKIKPLGDFHKRSNSADGRQGYCRPCRSEYERKRYEKCLGDGKNWAKDWRRKNKDRDNFLRHKRRQAGEGRTKHRAVAYSCVAEKRGIIVRPLLCDGCGLEKKLYRHHEDYSKPLEITWLCKKCHLALHKKNRQMAQSALLQN